MSGVDAAGRTKSAWVRYHDLIFHPEFLEAVREDGERLRFSKLDRAVLKTLSAWPGRLFTRDQLLAAMGPGPDVGSDRNVDFVINRLRRKLKDPARSPRFIATRYGEGYVWAAAAPTTPRSGFVVLGPVRGLIAPSQWPAVHGLVEHLRGRLSEHYRGAQEVVFLPERPTDPMAAGSFVYSVGVDVLASAGRLQIGLTLRREGERRAVRVVRAELEEGESGFDAAAESLISAIWRDLALSPADWDAPGGGTLEIRMQEAALTLSRTNAPGWRYIAERLAHDLRSTPDDPVLAVMSAVNLFAHMLHAIDFESENPKAFERQDSEIERLVLGALPAVREDPLLALAAAKLLLAVHRGHDALIDELLAEATERSASFAAVLSMQAQVMAYRGDLDGAIAALDQAIALCRPRSEFDLQLQVIKSRCLIAKDDYANARRVFDYIVAAKPQERGYLRLFYMAPGEEGPAFRHMTHANAAKLAGWLLFMDARGFGVTEHARKVVAVPLQHLLRRFGPSILPADLPAPVAALVSH